MNLKKTPLTIYEKGILFFIFLLIAIGVIGSFINIQWYEQQYAEEDGFIEWLTVLPLLIACGTTITYLILLADSRSWLFFVCALFISIFSFFVAGEEVSWGQRVFHLKSSEYFVEHNAQHETNIHNLVVNGEKLNKIIFSTLLSIMIGIYLIVFTILYRRNNKFQSFIDWAGIPIARLYQIIAVIGVFATTAVCPSGKRAEMLEFGICFVFLLIVLFPENKHVFRKEKQALSTTTK